MDGVAKRWVLETSTKGTGATIRPLPTGEEARGPERGLQLVPPVPRDDAPVEAPEAPRAPRRFRVVDVMTGEVLADDASMREAVDALGDVRSVVDVTVSVWHEADGRWRLLTRREQDALWRHRPAPAPAR
jgi:Ser/Thr protein kinase RdoA (MazF antagonist)